MPLIAGSKLGPYEILAPLGAGGMGEVYRARDPRLNREVAIKVLLADRMTDGDRRRRFLREARAASALSHPHIVTIYEVETVGSVDFLVMEYVRGKSLDALIPRHGLGVRETLRIASAVADALAAAHAHGIVHRDLKPANVIVGQDGAVKVLDFGLAKLLYEDVEATAADGSTRTMVALTEPGVVMGTLAYMAPEQAAGDTTDARSDIFSFGAMLYEMVTGRRAFAGKSAAETLELVLQARPMPPSALAAQLPPDLERVILRCLRKDPARRFQAMADLRIDLLEIDEAHDSGNRPLRSPSPHRRGRGPATVAAAVALVAILAAGAGWFLRGWPVPSQPRAQAPLPRVLTRLTFDEGLQTDVTWSPDGRSIAYTSDRTGNFDIWVQSIETGDARQLTRSPAHDRQPTWSPSGNMIVFRSDREGGGLFAVPAGGGAERRLTSFGVRPRWAPDGSRVLFAASDLYQGGQPTQLYTVRLDGKQPLPVLQTFLKGLGEMRDWNWYADASRVSVLADETPSRGLGVYVVPLSGEPAVRLNGTTALGRWNAFAWSSPTTLFVDCNKEYVHSIVRFTVDPATMRVMATERVTTGDHWEPRLALSLDGRRLAFTTTRMSMRLWTSPFDSATGRITGRDEPVTDAAAYVQNAELTRDGTKLAYLRRHPGSHRVALWTTDLGTGQSRELARDDQIRDFPSWSRDGSRLAYRWVRLEGAAGEAGLAVRRMDSNEEELIATPGPDSLVDPWDWSADGRLILASTVFRKTGSVSLGTWPLAAAPHAETAMRVLTEDKDYTLWQGKFSPDGRWICFIAVKTREPGTSTIFVMPSGGGDRSTWRAVTGPHGWADKPRWSADGKLLYFMQQQGSFFNVWAVGFDVAAGTPIGPPFQVTSYDSPRHQLSPEIGSAEIAVSLHRLVLTIMEQSGSLWMLDNVDR